MKKILILICAVVFTGTLLSSRWADPIAVLLAKLKVHGEKHQQEKVHLHFDKPYYTVGDNIWFKAYVMNARTGAPSSISNVLYVELINEKDSVKKLALPLENGITWGDYHLPDTLMEGNYRVRAYTTWMRNAGPDFFFDKTIKIGNSQGSEVFTETSYKFQTNNVIEKINSIVRFTNPAKTPYANINVQYEIRSGNYTVTKGRETTNENGEIGLDFDLPSANRQTVKILATLTLPNKKKVLKELLVTGVSSRVDVQFFPEGGAMIEDLPGRIGVKAINSTGLGEPVSGDVVDQAGATAASFRSSNLGMGNFFLRPRPGKTYFAMVRFKDGSTAKVPLPKPERSGHVLTVNNEDDAKMDVRVLLSPELTTKEDLTLVGQKNGRVYFTKKLPTETQVILFSIDKTKLPSGIIQLTLFSSKNLPVAERLIFVNNKFDKLTLTTSQFEPTYLTRGHTNFNFHATADGYPAEANFSVSVTNSDIVKPDPDNESNIFASLLLTSDLKGYVEKPNFYFKDESPETKAALDNLLLTQGWRKISWESLDAERPPAYPAEKFFTISGTITSLGIPLGNLAITLVGSDGSLIMLDTLTDNKGRFRFDGLSYRDSTKFLVQLKEKTKDKNVKIVIDQTLEQNLTPNKNIADLDANVSQSVYSYVQQNNNFLDQQRKKGLIKTAAIVIPEIMVLERRRRFPNSSNLNGPGRADAAFTAEDMKNAQSLTGFLTGRVQGVSFRNGIMSYTRYGQEPIVPFRAFIDGALLPPEAIEEWHIQDFESVEIITSPLYGAAYTAPPVIIITTKRGLKKPRVMRPVPGVANHNPRGFSYIRTFYSPVYGYQKDQGPDYRTTIFWNPSLLTTEDGKAEVSFYNNDVKGNYRIVIEGIDADGRIGRKVLNYLVE